MREVNILNCVFKKDDKEDRKRALIERTKF